jgi:hypothetical protein
MAELKYVCSISVMSTKGVMILAGTSFDKAEVSEKGFDSLVKGGYISEEGKETDAPTSVARPLISVPEKDSQAVNAKQADKAAKDAQKQADKAAKDAQKQADKAAKDAQKKQEAALKKIEADQVFNADPAKLEESSFEVLSASYFDVCKKYELNPVKIATKAEVIAELSKHFVKK